MGADKKINLKDLPGRLHEEKTHQPEEFIDQSNIRKEPDQKDNPSDEEISRYNNKENKDKSK